MEIWTAGELAWNLARSDNTGELINRGLGRRKDPILEPGGQGSVRGAPRSRSSVAAHLHAPADPSRCQTAQRGLAGCRRESGSARKAPQLPACSQRDRGLTRSGFPEAAGGLRGPALRKPRPLLSPLSLLVSWNSLLSVTFATQKRNLRILAASETFVGLTKQQMQTCRTETGRGQKCRAGGFR